MGVLITSQQHVVVGGPNITEVIAPGVTAWNDSSGAGDPAMVENGFTGDWILNYGGILNSFADGLLMEGGATGTVVNEAYGSIAGTIGVAFDSVGAGTSFANLGSVTGIGGSGGAVVLSGTTAGVVIDNRGLISDIGQAGIDGGVGIVDQATGGGNTILNVGTIAGLDGVKVDTASGEVTFINNVGGTIRGPTWAVLALHGAVNLQNSGFLVGSFESSSPDGNDVVVNTGHISGSVLLGAGNDSFTGVGGASGEVFGQDGIDHLIGGSGADKLSGGAGNDVLSGGPGNDQFIFDAALNASTNVDHLTDFTPGKDKIAVSHTIFTAVGGAGVLGAAKFYQGSAAHDASDRIVYNPANGHLIYDSNGNAAGHSTLFATLAAHLTLHNTDFFVI